MARPKKTAVRLHEPTNRGDVGLYTLEVFLHQRPDRPRSSPRRTRWSPAPSRSVATRPSKTCTTPSSTPSAAGKSTCTSSSSARGRWTRRHRGTSCRAPSRSDMGEENPPAGRVDQTTHRVAGPGGRATASATGSTSATTGGTRSTSRPSRTRSPSGKFPKVTKRVGKSPPQYARGRRIGGDGALPAGSPAQRKGTGGGRLARESDEVDGASGSAVGRTSSSGLHRQRSHQQTP